MLGALALVVWVGFKREYVMPASGLVDVTTTATPQ